MIECAECGASGDPKLFSCSYCDQQFCSAHRLPESHDCDSFDVLETPLEGEGPETRDRRSTWRKQIERVREKETEKWERRAPDRQPDRGASEPDVSDLPACEDCHRLRDDLEDVDGKALCSECREERQHRRADSDSTDEQVSTKAPREEQERRPRLHGWDYGRLAEEWRDDGRQSLLIDAAVLILLVAIVVAGAGLLVLI